MDWTGPAAIVVALINLVGVLLVFIQSQRASIKVAEAHTLTVKTEQQTNSKLSELDQKLRDQEVVIKAHESQCQDSKLKIADLTLRLAEAINRISK